LQFTREIGMAAVQFTALRVKEVISPSRPLLVDVDVQKLAAQQLRHVLVEVVTGRSVAAQGLVASITRPEPRRCRVLLTGQRRHAERTATDTDQHLIELPALGSGQRRAEKLAGAREALHQHLGGGISTLSVHRPFLMLRF
jgi:hypothetical protein